VVQETGSRGGKKETDERRYAMDLTLSAPKSVSIAALVGGDERLMQAHDRANAAAMAWAEENMVFARIGKSGADSEFTGNAAIASYTHETARTVGGLADSQLHSHNLVMNMTQKKDGTWASARLDFGKNNEKFKVLDSIYKAELAKAVREAGYEIEHTQDGFEIAGISRDQIESFSGRKNQIDEALKEHGLSRETASAQQRDNANTVTRGGKSQLSDVEQRYEWRERAREQGIDLQSLREQSQERQASATAQQRITGEDAVKSALHHLSERDSTFSETALLDEALKAGLGDVTHDEIRKAIDDRVGGLVAAGEVDRGEGKKEAQFTTKAAVFREAEILQRATDGQGKAEALIAIDQEIKEVVSDVSFTSEEIENGKRSSNDRSSVSSLEETGALSEKRMRNLSQRGLDADQVRENSDVLPGHAGAGGSGNQHLRRAVDDERVSKIISDFEKKKGFMVDPLVKTVRG
jgi:conjugative relaxase-like TrwC/TraI family protein